MLRQFPRRLHEHRTTALDSLRSLPDGRADLAAQRATGRYPALLEDRPLKRGEVPSLHSFRHTVATRLSANGATAEEIARQLRHKNSNVTRTVYIHEIQDQEHRQGQRERVAEII